MYIIKVCCAVLAVKLPMVYTSRFYLHLIYIGVAAKLQIQKKR